MSTNGNGIAMATTPNSSSLSNNNNTSTVGESSNSDLTSELLAEDLSGICECGACTVSTFLQNINCPRPSSIPALSLPFIDLSHLDAVQRQLHLGRLYLEYKTVVNRFSKLTHAVQRFVAVEKRIPFASFSKTLAKLDSFMPSLPQDDKIVEIRKSKTIPKLFTMLPDTGAFLDYHVYEDIAVELKSGEVRAQIAAYKKLLECYCERSVFDCPSFSATSKQGHSNFIIEIQPGQYSMKIHQLLAIQEQLCGVLGVVANTLCLCNASKMQSRNIQVIFRVPNYVKDVLMPLNAEQEAAMRELGFIGWSLYNGMDISYDPAQLANQLLATDRLADSLTSSMANHITAATASNTLPDVQRVDDMSSDEDEDDDSLPRKKLKPAPGKKTRGRVKIPMEYIKNKLRRYTTFSKRKSNIMKKAYELSTLTGTQVMLMVASETGHVYTFATPKLQPMITSDAGKALIQTCLHQPDPLPVSNSRGSGEKERTRMSSTGYEETDLGGYLPRVDNGKNKNHPTSTSSLMPTSVNHTMPSVYTPPPPSLPLSLANELLPSGMLHSLVSSSSHSSLLPPPLISPEGYSPGVPDEDGDHISERALAADGHSPES